MKTKLLLTTWLVPFFIYTTVAQNWEIETLRTNIVGAWSRTADFDLDGDPDILVQSGDSVLWYENLRPGWVEHLIDPTFYNSVTAWVDVQDLDGDGDMDVLKIPFSGTPNYPLTWNENLSNGIFWVQHTILESPNYLGWMHGSYGDMDGDNDFDIVIPEYNGGMGSLYWLENMEDSEEYTKHTLKTGDHYYSSVADFDGDGDLDIVSAFNDVFWLENHLPDTVWTQHQVAAPGSSYHIAGVCSDLNGDGAIDIISNPLFGGDDRVVLYSNPNWPNVTINAAPSVLLGEIGDIDGDGDPDVTYGGLGNSLQAMGWAENQNNGSNWLLHDIIPAKTSQRFCTGLADIDGDGDLDMVSLDAANTGTGDVFWAANPVVSGTSNSKQKQFEVLLSPNPTGDYLTIQLPYGIGGTFTLQILDLTGRVLQMAVLQGTSTLSLDVEGLSSGAYLLKVLNGNNVFGGKFLKA